MNYIGSKYSLLDFIHRTISDVTGYKSGDDYILQICLREPGL